MKKLTKLQRKHWNFIRSYYEEHGFMPGYSTLQDEFGYSSPNSVFQHLNGLIKKKYLVKSGRGNYEIHPQKRSSVKGFYPGTPIQGRISAGGMYEAIEEDMGYLPFKIHPSSSTQYFSLLVEGDSMMEANIRDGDYIILNPVPPNNGQIAAINYRGETTLKTVYQKDNSITLQPENKMYEPIEIEPGEWEEVNVFGTYVGKAWKNNDNWSLVFES